MSLQQIREGTISLTSCCWWWRQCYQRIGILVFVSVDVEIQEGGGWRFKASTATAALDKEDRKSPTDFVQHQNSNHRILLLLQEIIIRNWCILLPTATTTAAASLSTSTTSSSAQPRDKDDFDADIDMVDFFATSQSTLLQSKKNSVDSYEKLSCKAKSFCQEDG
jgi:hypothetical protein